MADRDARKAGMEEALADAFNRQEKRLERLQEDIEGLRVDAAKGNVIRRKLVAASVVIGVIVALALGYVMFREPQYRSIFAFLIVCLLFSGALHFFRRGG